MCDKSILKLIIVKVEPSIDLKVGVKQENRMAPVIFLFKMMAFAKTLEDKWTALGLVRRYTHQDQPDN